MAGFAGLMASIGNGLGPHFGQSVAAIVAVLAKALWDELDAKNQEEHDARGKNACQAEQVRCILEFHPASLTGGAWPLDRALSLWKVCGEGKHAAVPLDTNSRDPRHLAKPQNRLDLNPRRLCVEGKLGGLLQSVRGAE